ncbi:unnamed protein product, partial [Polarella glacialis]
MSLAHVSPFVYSPRPARCSGAPANNNNNKSNNNKSNNNKSNNNKSNNKNNNNNNVSYSDNNNSNNNSSASYSEHKYNSVTYPEQWLSAAAPRVRQPPGLQEPAFVNLPTFSAGCEWMQDEVAFVQTQEEEEQKCQEQARIPSLDCQVPELVRCAGRGDLAGVRRLLDSGMDANIQ